MEVTTISLKSKKSKGGGISKFFDKIFRNFELPKNKCSWHCSHSLLVLQSISAVSFPDYSDVCILIVCLFYPYFCSNKLNILSAVYTIFRPYRLIKSAIISSVSISMSQPYENEYTCTSS